MPQDTQLKCSLIQPREPGANFSLTFCPALRLKAPASSVSTREKAAPASGEGRAGREEVTFQMTLGL